MNVSPQPTMCPGGHQKRMNGCSGSVTRIAAKALLVRNLELVQPLDVEDRRALRPVDLERVRVDPATGEPRGLERAGDAVLELDDGDEVVVDLPPGDDRAHDRRHRCDLADEVAREVDDVGAEIADRAGPGLRRIEAPGALVGLPAPGLQVAGPEVDDVAELAGLQQLPHEAHRGDEAVVEAAHVRDAGLLGLLPHPMRLLRREAERLLAEDVLAVPRRLDAGLGVDRVRAAVVEELHALVRDLLAPVGDCLGPAPALARRLDRVAVAAGDRDELGPERHVEVPERLQRAGVGLAHERVAEHRDSDTTVRHVPGTADRLPAQAFAEPFQ